MRRPKFARVLTDDMRHEIMELLIATAVWFEPDVSVRDCRDSKDNKYLELALAAKAEVIVSSDADLVDMDPWRGVRILLPAAFLSWRDQRT